MKSRIFSRKERDLVLMRLLRIAQPASVIKPTFKLNYLLTEAHFLKLWRDKFTIYYRARYFSNLSIKKWAMHILNQRLYHIACLQDIGMSWRMYKYQSMIWRVWIKLLQERRSHRAIIDKLRHVLFI